MSRRPSTVSSRTDPEPPRDRSRTVIGLIRVVLLLGGAAMLGYALRVYFAGIHPRLPAGAFRVLLPALFAVALVGFLYGALREIARIRKGR